MTKFIRWSGKTSEDVSYGGTVRFINNHEDFTFEKVSGSCIPTQLLVHILWTHSSLQSFRDSALKLKRKNNWSLGRHDGMSGCTDWYICFERNGYIFHTKGIIHSSMNGLQNEDIKNVWIKDVFDCLWAMKQEGTCYCDAFTKALPFNIYDITKDVEERRENFKKICYDESDGYGTEFPESSDEEIVDYSNYTPSEGCEIEKGDSDE